MEKTKMRILVRNIEWESGARNAGLPDSMVVQVDSDSEHPFGDALDQVALLTGFFVLSSIMEEV